MFREFGSGLDRCLSNHFEQHCLIFFAIGTISPVAGFPKNAMCQ